MPKKAPATVGYARFKLARAQVIRSQLYNEKGILLKVLSLACLEIRYDMRRQLILHKKRISSVAKGFSLPPLSEVQYSSGYLLFISYLTIIESPCINAQKSI